jgi:predicted O-methyltransferase YrrM
VSGSPEAVASPDVIDWFGPKSFKLDGQQFRLEVDASALFYMRSGADGWVLGKDDRMVQRFLQRNAYRLDRQRIVDLGIFQGGSAVFEYLVCKPVRLVAFELRDARIAVLDEFIERHGLQDAIRLHYGVDQGDTEALSSILETEFGGRPLDLVIDDASHLYQPTRASFEVLFPRLRKGGIYVIEDWDWAHHPEWQENEGYFRDEPALTNLIVEILMLAGARPDIVADVAVTSRVAEIVRGTAALDSRLDIDSLYLNRGRRVEPLL